MSGIWGLIHLDERPADREAFQAMTARMAGWGPDGMQTHCFGGAAFGQARLVVSPECRFEAMPAFDENTKMLFTAAARLDNRDELCDIFQWPTAQRCELPDGRLVMAAYQKWGPDACRKLYGDWSFAAWHAREKKLFLARDHLGSTGLFYYFKPPLIVFASSPEAVIAHPDVCRSIDEIRLAKNLGVETGDQDDSRTFWKDVRYLSCARRATLSSDICRVETYWRFDDAPSVRLGADGEYLEAFTEHFRRAVRVRLRSTRPVGTQLSAGLDSGAVTALAAQELQKEESPLVAYTAIPLYPAEKYFPKSLTDEWPLAHTVAKRYDAIEHIAVDARNISPLAALRRSLDIVHAPLHAAGNMNWIIAIFDQAQRRHLGVMLTGQLGNGSVSWSGGRDYLFYCLARGSWHKRLLFLKGLKKHQRVSVFRELVRQMVGPGFLPRFSGFVQPAYRYYSFPQEDFIRHLGLKQAARKNLIPRRVDPLTERTLTLMRNAAMVGPLWQAFGSFYNLEVRDPTADIRLVEFCAGVPDELYTAGGGRRMLIRRAMEGHVPDDVRLNMIRGRQSADLICRVLEQQTEVARQLDALQSLSEVTKYIDIDAMKKAFARWAGALSPDAYPLLSALLRALQTAYFLVDAGSRNI